MTLNLRPTAIFQHFVFNEEQMQAVQCGRLLQGEPCLSLLLSCCCTLWRNCWEATRMKSALAAAAVDPQRLVSLLMVSWAHACWRCDLVTDEVETMVHGRDPDNARQRWGLQSKWKVVPNTYLSAIKWIVCLWTLVTGYDLSVERA